ncbi:Membrin [Cocos nucifera]|nr:Membrin [Cocos nucifera]
MEGSGGGGGGGGGGGTISDVYQSARRLLLRTRDALERLERLDSSFPSSSSAIAAGVSDSPELALSIKRDITQIHTLCADMDRLWRSIAAKSQRDLWKRAFKADWKTVWPLRLMDVLGHCNNGDYQFCQELELNGCEDWGACYGSLRAQRKALDILNTVGLSNSVLKLIERRHRVDKWIAYAGPIAINIVPAVIAVIRAQRKALDILNTVGLSNSVLKLIERRHRVDKWIAYAGPIAINIVPAVIAVIEMYSQTIDSCIDFFFSSSNKFA